MRRLVSIIVVSSLLLALIFTQNPNMGDVEASPDVHQGDLVLTDNDVYVIENQRFDINGSIIVEENATLILRNGIINFTQMFDEQFNMTFQNPSSGNPRLIVENAELASVYGFLLYFYGTSSATVHRLQVSTPGWANGLSMYDNSVASISHTAIYSILAKDSSVVEISNSNMRYMNALDDASVNFSSSEAQELQCYGSSVVNVSNSTITFRCTIGSISIDCRVLGLKPGLFSFWNYWLDCSVVATPDGYAPQLTLKDSQITHWAFSFYGSSNATISNSTIFGLVTNNLSVANVSNSHAFYSVGATKDSAIQLVNSTYTHHFVYDRAHIRVYWYLDVHVVDSIAGDVPSADVTATYPNATVAGSKLTDAKGWARLTLLEKTMNATGEYPVGTYTVEASYETYSNSTTVDMAGNQIATLLLSELLIAPWDMTGPTMWVPDGKCDMRDVALVAKLYGALEGDGTYDVRADITGLTYLVADGKIDIRDIALVARHFGEIY